MTELETLKAAVVSLLNDLMNAQQEIGRLKACIREIQELLNTKRKVDNQNEYGFN